MCWSDTALNSTIILEKQREADRETGRDRQEERRRKVGRKEGLICKGPED